MDVNLTTPLLIKIRTFLIFFYAACTVGCRQQTSNELPEIQYNADEAVSVTFRAAQAPDHYKVYRSGEDRTPVLGEFNSDGSRHTFVPLIPFTAGLSYVIRAGEDSIMGFEVPMPASFPEPPQLLAIYPLQDTVPENLLKVYLQFSEPMQGVGNALDYIQVTDVEQGAEIKVFLDLEAELWDAGHRRLTLWLDPGRIKKGLIPNRDLGTPLIAGKHYVITISDGWRSAQGVPLGNTYKKSLIVTDADTLKPEADQWVIRLPTAGGAQPLELIFRQGMDLLMAGESSRILSGQGTEISGEWGYLPNGSGLIFRPSEPWEPGNYRLYMDANTEDLAGNTVNRLFDTDLERGGVVSAPDSLFRSFSIAD